LGSTDVEKVLNNEKEKEKKTFFFFAIASEGSKLANLKDYNMLCVQIILQKSSVAMNRERERERHIRTFIS